MANNDKENKIEKFTKEAIGKTLNQFNKEIGMADLVEVNKNQDRILNGILSQVNDESTEKTEKSNIITLDNSTDGVVELKEIQGDTNVNVSKIEEMPITHDIGDKEGNVFTLNEITKGAISIGEIQGNTMVNCNKDDKKELVLMKDLSTQGDNNITLTEGVDGGLVDVALEGNTLVNVSKTKDSTAITMSYTAENSGNHIALQGDIDGSCRPVITGNTLVNLIDKFGDCISSQDSYNADNKGFTLTKKQDGGITYFRYKLKYALDKSKKYTIIYDIVENTLVNTDPNFGIYTDGVYGSIGSTTTTGGSADGKLGRIVSVHDVKSGNDNLDYLSIGIHQGDAGGKVVVDNLMLLEGDYTDKPIPDYFDGLQSSFEDNLVTQEMVDSGEEVVDNLGKYRVEYKITGKNKCPNKFYSGWANSLAPLGSTDNVVTELIKVKPNSNYTINKSDFAYLFKYDSNKKFIGQEVISQIFNTKEAVYIRVAQSIGSSSMHPENYNNTFQIEEGNTATSYEPYKESTKTLYLNSPLLEGDTIEEKDDGIYHVHRYKEIVLDGSNDEDWVSDGSSDTHSGFFMITRNFNSNVKLNKVISDIYPTIPVYPHWKARDIEGCIDNTGNIAFIINNSKLTKITVLGFRAYLNQNPITAVYGLATPQYELIEQSNLVIPSYANGHLDFSTAVPVEKVDFLPFNEELTYLYANTQYTLQFMSDKAILVDYYLGGTLLLSQNIVEGLNRISMTTPSELVDNKLTINGNDTGANIMEVIVTDADRELIYFEGMKSVGECEELQVISINSDKHLANTQRLTHEPLRGTRDAKDKYVLIDGKWYIERKCGIRAYQEGDKDNYKTDLINTVYPLEMPAYEEIDYNPLEVYSGTTHITTNSTVPTNITVKNHGFNCLLKPSTTYTISSNLGLNTVTTPSTLTEDCLRFMDTDTSDITTMKNVLVLEGDWTTKANLIPANFSGIESAFEQELVTDENDEHYGKYKVTAKVVGKNLFGTTWKELGTDRLVTVEKVYIEKGKTYWLTMDKLTETYPKGNFQIWLMKSNTKIPTHANDYSKGVIQCIANWKLSTNNGYSFTSNYTGYVYIQTRGGRKELLTLCNKTQLEQGDIATAYEPYKESDVTFYIDEPLRGVGDVKDKVFIQDDKVVVQRNCASVTLDGGENESYRVWSNASKKQTQNVFILNHSNEIFKNIALSSDGHYAVKYTSDNFYCGVVTSNGFVCQYYKYMYLGLPKACLENEDELNIKKWLSENPTTVVYQLAEPTYEEVEYSSNRLILDTFNNESFNNSTLFLDTNISPKLSFKPLYEELVYVKNSTKYYIQFNAVGSGEVVINLGGTEITTEIVEGYNCIPITTPSESTNLMTIIGQGITISEVVVSEVICGGYYKGLQSCFEEHMENGKYRVLLRGIALDGSKVNGIKLYINEPLRGIGDTKDRLCIKNGKLMVERKCSEAIFDGSDDEKWTLRNHTQGIAQGLPCDRYALDGDAFKDGKEIGDYYSGALCDKLKVIKGADSQNKDIVGIVVNGGTGNWRLMITTKLDSKPKFISWLQQNPITIVYQLAEPVYEEATNEYGLPIVFEGYENGIVYIDSAVTPTTHIKYTSNNQLATTLSEAEEQNISTQEDINMNVVTYMMDIDMILTEMEMSNDTSVMAVRRDSSNENMLDRMSEEDKKVYRDNTVVMLEKMITAKVLEKEDIERRINMYYDKNRISKEQYKYLKSLL